MSIRRATIRGDWTHCPVAAVSATVGPRHVHGRASSRVVVRVVLLVHVQRVVVGVPGRHQVAGGWHCRRIGDYGWGREARGGGTALI